ncbi:hypothetical protein HMSSN036_32380 [Paenibacillus macerans]|nr:hypothetical protein HMSSN036_32380 [Paenibacillus macerans]
MGRIAETLCLASGKGEKPLQLTEAQASRLPRLEGLEVLPYVTRYDSGMRGNQWLGYVAQRPDVIRRLRRDQPRTPLPMTLQVGAAGLEKTFDRYLRGIGGVRAAFTVDGQKRPLDGLGTRINANGSRYYPLQIKTTVDEGVQRGIERLAAEMNVKEGAVVVLDADNGDIVSMVSLPFYDPRHVDPKRPDWANKAVKRRFRGRSSKRLSRQRRLRSMFHPRMKPSIAADTMENTDCPAGRKAVTVRLR